MAHAGVGHLKARFDSGHPDHSSFAASDVKLEAVPIKTLYRKRRKKQWQQQRQHNRTGQHNRNKEYFLKVSSRSDPNKVAGAIAGIIREYKKAETQTIGAGALNQAIKAIAIARGFVAPQGIDLVCYPAFADVEIDGQERTAIKLFIEPRKRPQE